MYSVSEMIKKVKFTEYGAKRITGSNRNRIYFMFFNSDQRIAGILMKTGHMFPVLLYRDFKVEPRIWGGEIFVTSLLEYV